MPEPTTLHDPRKVSGMAGVLLGHVHSVSGSQASIGLLSTGGLHRAGATVGKFVKVHSGKAFLIGVITDLSVLLSRESKDQGYCGTARIDLIGEIIGQAGMMRFRRGITEYPTIGDEAAALSTDELRLVFDTA